MRRHLCLVFVLAVMYLACARGSDRPLGHGERGYISGPIRQNVPRFLSQRLAHTIEGYAKGSQYQLESREGFNLLLFTRRPGLIKIRSSIVNGLCWGSLHHDDHDGITSVSSAAVINAAHSDLTLVLKVVVCDLTTHRSQLQVFCPARPPRKQRSSPNVGGAAKENDTDTSSTL